MTPDPSPDPPLVPTGRWPRPWRSAGLGWAVAALALLGGVPLFLCMPPWADVTLYDVAVRNLRHGGVHYRDVFDTNLPGFVWALAAVRWAVGPGYEALRAVDLLVVGAAAGAVGWLGRRAGATPAAVGWYAAAVALFYPFTSEFNHAQRDAWMLLPAAVAAGLRVRQLGRSAASAWWAVAEGFVWGLAVWVKPHVLLVGVGVWAVSAVRLGRVAGRRAVAADLGGLVAGGLLAGVPGVAWLVGSGAWPYFWDVFTTWNPDYLSGEWQHIPHKLGYAFWCFRPWGVVNVVALPLAGWDLARAFRSGRAGGVSPLMPSDPGAHAPRSPQTTDARAVLAALYLCWLLQAVFVQKGFEYVHVPVTLLGLAVLAGRGWAVGFPYLVWFAGVGLLLAVPPTARMAATANDALWIGWLERHPLADPAVMRQWPRCWVEGSSPALRDALGQYTGIHNAANWVELEAVADFLRTADPPVGDGELTGWHDSTHPLYLMLDRDPSTRYMHFGTVLAIRGKAGQIRREVADSRQRYVVSDLARMTWSPGRAREAGAAGRHPLPGWLPRSQRDRFPWDQPVVFRAGRYVVHRIDHRPDPARIDIPDWADLGSLGPGDD